MGNDGGSIAKRRDLAKHKKFRSRISCSAISSAKSNLCSLSQEPLSQPIVACKLGFLYNKSSLESSLSSNSLPPEFSHIRTLADVVELKVHQTASGISCPISGVDFNGVNKFEIMWDCGCLISAKALLEIPSANCLLCNTKIGSTVKIGLSKDEQKTVRKKLGIKSVKKEKMMKEGRGKTEIVDNEELEKVHQKGMESEVYRSLFVKEEMDETFCCRHRRAGLR
jgi:hypothetical protein